MSAWIECAASIVDSASCGPGLCHRLFTPLGSGWGGLGVGAWRLRPTIIIIIITIVVIIIVLIIIIIVIVGLKGLRVCRLKAPGDILAPHGSLLR